MGAIEKLLSVAEAEVGYIEKKSNQMLYDKTANAGSANYTKYGYEMHRLCPETMDYPAAWCDAFVDWCFAKAFDVAGALKLLHNFDDYTVNSASYFKQNKQWYALPKKGDQIFFVNSKGGICHTGLVYAVDDKYVYTIEGNTSSSSGVVANGGCVAKKKYEKTYKRIAGYGRPDYSLVEQSTNHSTNIFGTVTASTLNIRKEPTTDSAIVGTYHKGETVMIFAMTPNDWYRTSRGYVFSQYVEIAREALQEDNSDDVDDNQVPIDEWARNAVEYAKNKGIVIGDTTGDLRLDMPCSKEEVLVFLRRLHLGGV